MNKTGTAIKKSRFKINPELVMPERPYLPRDPHGEYTETPREYLNTQIYTQLEKIPYQATTIQYQEREVIERIPVEKTVMDYQAVKRVKSVPKERLVLDYYAKHKQVSYVPVVVPEKRIEYIPMEVQSSRLQYVPYTRDVIHLPFNMTRSTSLSAREQPLQSFQTPIKNQRGSGVKDPTSTSARNIHLLRPKSTLSFKNVPSFVDNKLLVSSQNESLKSKRMSKGLKILERVNKQLVLNYKEGASK